MNDERLWWTCQHQERQPEPCEKCEEPKSAPTVYNQECFRCKKIIGKIASLEQLAEEKHDCRPIENENLTTRSKEITNQQNKTLYLLLGGIAVLLIPIGILAYKLIRKR